MTKQSVQFGSLAWGLQTGGRLSTWDKIQLSIKALGTQIQEAFRKNRFPIPLDPKSIQLPDTVLVRNTLEYIREEHQTPLQHHCLRSFVIGELFGLSEKLKYDSEILAVSALLHDLGLEEKHCGLHPGIDCFAIEGALEAGKFLESLQMVSPEKTKIIQDAIAFHLNISIPASDVEAYLLNKGTATDTIGFYLKDLSSQTVNSLMELYPRLDFNASVHQQLKHQSKIRPHSRMAFLYQNGFGTRLMKVRFE
ncbi:MAG: hypothetical protein NW226_11150 [Microscillaceae bacterium]|nr:hypothetical protein [Microscillaceae bacterium]